MKTAFQNGGWAGRAKQREIFHKLFLRNRPAVVKPSPRFFKARWTTGWLGRFNLFKQ
jgi:hypothetical protein